MSRRPAPLFVVLALAGCAADEAAKDGASVPAASWNGPPLGAAFLADGSLKVVLTAPTAGHELALREVTVAGDVADVAFDLTVPGDGELTAQVITELELVVPAAVAGGAAPPAGDGRAELPESVRAVHVLVAHWKRGVQYVAAPIPERAATVTRMR